MTYYYRGISKYIVFYDHTGAANDFTKVKSLDPKFKPKDSDWQDQKEVHETVSKAMESYQLGHIKEAVGLLKYAMELDRHNPDIFHKYGKILFDQKIYDKAIGYFNRVILLDPHNAEAHYNRGSAEIKEGRKEQGCHDLSKAHELGYHMAGPTLKEHCQ